MDLLALCIVEGRSELRNVGRVNCKNDIGPFRAAEHLTHRTFISLCRLSRVFSRCLQRARLSVLYLLHTNLS